MEQAIAFSAKKEIEKEEFLRQLLIDLGKDPKTPVDVVDAQFGEVRESAREALLCSASVSGTCTASIGYDRKEPYTDYETYKEKVGETWVTRQRAVTKYRTVTDWRPFQTDYFGEHTCATENTDSERNDNAGLGNALATAANESIQRDGEREVNAKALSRAVMRCEAHVEVWNVKLPGDQQKDKRYNSTSDIKSVACYTLPFYEVTFTYEGKKYKASAFACGKLHVMCDVPKRKETPQPDPKETIEAEAKEKTGYLEQKAKKAWLVFWGALAVSALFCFALQFGWLWPAAVAALFLAYRANKKYNEEYQNCVNALAVEYAKNAAQSQAGLLRAKTEALNSALKRCGYQTLSKKETPEIDGESDAAVEKNIPKVAGPKSFKGKMIVSIILAVILVIASFSAHDNFVHSPRSVNVAVVAKQVEYDPNAGAYINGCYYVHVDFKVKAKWVTVKYVDVKVYVEDKDGHDIGYLTASLSGLHIEPGETETVTVTFKENQPEKDAFFTELYNTDFSQLNFEYEIRSISFDDGGYYSK